MALKSVYRIYFYCIFSFCGCVRLLAGGDNELVIIEQKIEALKERLSDNRLVQMSEEVEGQEMMIADWDAYSRELQRIQKKQEEDKSIENQIRVLEQHKAWLLKQKP